MLVFSFLIFMLGSSLILLSHGGNEYQIFYTYPGCEQNIPLELDYDSTVGDAMQRINGERTIAKGYEMEMSFKGDVLLVSQSLADAGIGADTVVDIIIIQLTPYQQIFNAFKNTNLKYLLKLGEDEQNCSYWKSFVKCDDTGNPIHISIYSMLELEGSIDFSLLPDGIESIGIANTNLHGTVDLMNLPQNLSRIRIGEYNFTVDLSRMHRDRWPKNLKEILIYGKKEFVFGRLDCSQLPRSLIRLNFDYLKQLDIVFNDLPPQLEFISMAFSVLNGLDLSNPLPQSLRSIAIRGIKIPGEIKLQGIRNCTSFTFLTCDTEMRERIKKVALDSEVNVKFAIL